MRVGDYARLLGDHGGDLQGVQHTAHPPAKRAVDQLVLRDAAEPGKLRSGDGGSPVIVVARTAWVSAAPGCTMP